MFNNILTGKAEDGKKVFKQSQKVILIWMGILP